MPALTDLSTIRSLCDRYGFSLSKGFGQNFIINPGVCPRIAESAGIGPEWGVLEIGPGIGVLTEQLAMRAARVVSVEIDRRLFPLLDETLAGLDNVKIINEDILKLDTKKLVSGENPENVKIMGNLPYYITTPIIMKLLEEGVKAESITIMMQKEVADRIRALPGTKAYGALSVAVQYYCTAEKILDVPRSAFVPQPNVDSAVLRLFMRREKPAVLTDEKLFFKCVKAGFSQRRKTLLNSMQVLKGTDRDLIRDSLEAAGIDPARRAETLTIEEFAKIANEVDKRL